MCEKEKDAIRIMLLRNKEARDVLIKAMFDGSIVRYITYETNDGDVVADQYEFGYTRDDVLLGAIKSRIARLIAREEVQNKNMHEFILKKREIQKKIEFIEVEGETFQTSMEGEKIGEAKIYTFDFHNEAYSEVIALIKEVIEKIYKRHGITSEDLQTIKKAVKVADITMGIIFDMGDED